MQTSAVGIKGELGPQNPTGKDAYDDLKSQDFLNMMIAELQNQDPLNPMDNTQLLTQINQIREIAANTKLIDTLDALSRGQELASAGSLLRQIIQGMTEEGDKVTGAVDRIVVENDKIYLFVGDKKVPMKNVGEIYPEGTDLAEVLAGQSDLTPEEIAEAGKQAAE
ncbi:hypothetical protein JCM19992_14250 [Thermostilla marina]